MDIQKADLSKEQWELIAKSSKMTVKECKQMYRYNMITVKQFEEIFDMTVGNAARVIRPANHIKVRHPLTICTPFPNQAKAEIFILMDDNFFERLASRMRIKSRR